MVILVGHDKWNGAVQGHRRIQFKLKHIQIVHAVWFSVGSIRAAVETVDDRKYELITTYRVLFNDKLDACSGNP